jgi:hypothetical protein
MRSATLRESDLVPVRSLFGRTLSMRWLVDALELAVRTRSRDPLRMWWHFKARALRGEG